MRRILPLLLWLLSSWAGAQEFEFHPPAAANDPALLNVMRDLAGRILPVYQESDQDKYLHNLSALQYVARNFPGAYASRQSLRDRRRSADARRPIARSVIFDIYTQARAAEADRSTPFPQAFTQAFQDTSAKLGDLDAYSLTGWLALPVSGFQDSLQRSLDQWRQRGNIPLNDAIDLVWQYFAYDAYRSFHPLAAALIAADDAKRYVTEWDLLIQTPEGAAISAVVVRPRDESKRLPALLEFTIYVDSRNFARECAARGYAGIVAFTRGERRSPGPVVPFQNDGEDARSVINWIAKQPWSDGRVGMYGGTYSAFTQWAALARKIPPALKAIATTSATAPGIDFPMNGNIMRTAGYRWSGCVSNNEAFDEKLCADDARWLAIDQDWYSSGKPYRALEHAIEGRNRIFHEWLDHPSYDRYWQKLVPAAEQFAHLGIPVLATTGYYGSGEAGTLYYFTTHYKHNPHANQTLLIGPWDDGAMQHGTAANLFGYATDPAAQLDLRELRYQWFDSIFKGAERPALLSDRVNYQVMGTNEWRHAPSLEAMGRGTLRFYLDPGKDAARHRLALKKGADTAFVQQIVRLDDRSDAARPLTADLLQQTLQTRDAIVYVSEPLKSDQEFAGLFSGRLELSINRQDLDLNITLYEELPGGEYLQLFSPAVEFRASYARDRITRRLLLSGVRQQLEFRSDRLTARRLQSGSRLVMVLGVNKRPDRQINYGTGGSVNEESIEDGRIPLRIRWYGGSYLDIPVHK